MALKGNLNKMKHLRAFLRKQPTTVADEAARTSAPPVTTDLRANFHGGRTAYGDARPLGVDGEPLSLVKEGEVRDQLGFVALGHQMRAKLGPRYAKYLIGKYDILPNGAMPRGWKPIIKKNVDRAFEGWTLEARKGGR